jgi:DNA-binding NtrC family response regulator
VADSILFIDDDVSLLRSLGEFFERRDWDVYRELTGEAGLATHARALPDVVVCDLRLPGIDGMEVLERLRGQDSAVIMLTGDGHLPTAVQAMRNGAENFLVKPIDLEHLAVVCDRAVEKVRLRRVNRALIGRGANAIGPDALGSSPPMRSLRDRITMLARSDQPAILVRGETGTGKAMLARMIHDLSPRAAEPFIECVAAATDAAGLEATIFGVEGAAGNGEDRSRQGLLEIADRGTLVLEEITGAPVEVQTRLEAMLDQHAVRRSGGTREIPVDVRLIATTSKDPEAEVGAGHLDPELYYRLKAMSVTVPPLRDRGIEDLAALFSLTVTRLAPGMPGSPTVVSDEALERLASHPWPGNMREMRHVLERAMMLARGSEAIGIEHLPGEFRARPGPFDRRHTPLTMEEVERMHIERTLKHHGGNRTRASRELGISRATLIAKIKRYAIPH